MDMHLLIHTPRLIIRPLQPADAPGMFLMDADPEVHKYVGGNPTKDIQHTQDVIANIRRQYADNGIGRWAVIDKATGSFVGWTGFKLMDGPVNGHNNFIDFGYRLARRYWGQGLGYESALAALHYGIKEYGYKDLYAMTDIDNAGSRRILEKLGFTHITTFPYDAEPLWRTAGQPTTWYHLHLPA